MFFNLPTLILFSQKLSDDNFALFVTECGGKNFHFIHASADIGKAGLFPVL